MRFEDCKLFAAESGGDRIVECACPVEALLRALTDTNIKCIEDAIAALAPIKIDAMAPDVIPDSFVHELAESAPESARNAWDHCYSCNSCGLDIEDEAFEESSEAAAKTILLFAMGQVCSLLNTPSTLNVVASKTYSEAGLLEIFKSEL